MIAVGAELMSGRVVLARESFVVIQKTGFYAVHLFPQPTAEGVVIIRCRLLSIFHFFEAVVNRVGQIGGKTRRVFLSQAAVRVIAERQIS